MSIADPSHPGAVRGSISYGVGGAPSLITIGQLQFVRPERTFAADCGHAVLRFDSPEVHFGQLDPYNENRLVRSLTIRFERGRFVERATANEPFRSALEQALTSTPSPPHEHRAPRRAGYLSDLMARARFDGEPVTALVDAEFDLLSHSGGRAGMVILVTSQNQLASAIAARADELHFEPALEVTMTAALLADLLLSWKNLAETIT